jgi:hypothetical protein
MYMYTYRRAQKYLELVRMYVNAYLCMLLAVCLQQVSTGAVHGSYYQVMCHGHGHGAFVLAAYPKGK